VCKPAPCAAGLVTAPPTGTSTTGTATAPPPATTSTNTTTTGTGTTSSGTPHPGEAHGGAWFACGPPPFCPRGAITAGPLKGTGDTAAIERKLEALRRANAALAAQLARERKAKH
jgi:hypothetical protein